MVSAYTTLRGGTWSRVSLPTVLHITQRPFIQPSIIYHSPLSGAACLLRLIVTTTAIMGRCSRAARRTFLVIFGLAPRTPYRTYWNYNEPSVCKWEDLATIQPQIQQKKPPSHDDLPDLVAHPAFAPIASTGA